jgi:hypothetical protein
MATCYINSDSYFRPQRMFITSISQADPAVITTSIDHNYMTGLLVQFFLPKDSHMQELNGKSYYITVTGDDTFTIPVDSTNYDAYVDPADPNICGQAVPTGEINSSVLQAVRNIKER